MAITLADFTRIWASTSPLTPYSFSDSNYEQGWNFVGATPPARQMWDSIQKQNDEKLLFLCNSIFAGNPLTLTADDGNGNTVSLVGEPNGSLTWNGKEVERVNASGSNYIRFESGVQICWGAGSVVTTNAGTSTTTKITFPVAFKNTDYVVSFVDSFNSGDWGNHSFSTSTYSTTGVWLYLQNNKTAAYTYALKWMAIGYWK